MDYQPKFTRKRRRRRTGRPVILLAWAAGVLLACVIVMVAMLPGQTQESSVTAPALSATEQTTQATTAAATETSPADTTAPPKTEPEILPYFADMAAKNPDMVGWVRIDGTKLDYPLMYTPEDPEKYLHLDFEGSFSVGGLPFIDGNCSLDPVSDNLLIYGHNMENGTMFRTLMNYDRKTFWEQHPVIHLSTLYEEKTYEILAAVYDRVYFESEDCFKFYRFIDAGSKEDFDAAIAYFKEHALYDTGVTAEYGDKLITLVTCAYHVDNGRFVVVARQTS